MSDKGCPIVYWLYNINLIRLTSKETYLPTPYPKPLKPYPPPCSRSRLDPAGSLLQRARETTAARLSTLSHGHIRQFFSPLLRPQQLHTPTPSPVAAVPLPNKPLITVQFLAPPTAAVAVSIDACYSHVDCPSPPHQDHPAYLDKPQVPIITTYQGGLVCAPPPPPPSALVAALPGHGQAALHRSLSRNTSFSSGSLPLLRPSGSSGMIATASSSPASPAGATPGFGKRRASLVSDEDAASHKWDTPSSGSIHVGGKRMPAQAAAGHHSFSSPNSPNPSGTQHSLSSPNSPNSPPGSVPHNLSRMQSRRSGLESSSHSELLQATSPPLPSSPLSSCHTAAGARRASVSMMPGAAAFGGGVGAGLRQAAMASSSPQLGASRGGGKPDKGCKAAGASRHWVGRVQVRHWVGRAAGASLGGSGSGS